MQHHSEIHKIKYLIFLDRSKIIIDHTSRLKYLSHTPGRWEGLWHTLLIYLPHPNHQKNLAHTLLILLQLCMTEEIEYLIYGHHFISFLDCLNHRHLRHTARDIISFPEASSTKPPIILSHQHEESYNYECICFHFFMLKGRNMLYQLVVLCLD